LLLWGALARRSLVFCLLSPTRGGSLASCLDPLSLSPCAAGRCLASLTSLLPQFPSHGPAGFYHTRREGEPQPTGHSMGWRAGTAGDGGVGVGTVCSVWSRGQRAHAQGQGHGDAPGLRFCGNGLVLLVPSAFLTQLTPLGGRGGRRLSDPHPE
jgi:hypothetical protein